MKCKLCKKKLGKYNKSGYCTKCYTKSPEFRLYHRNYHKKVWYPKYGKNKNREYRKKNFKRIQRYQKKYQKKNIIRIRELKRNWARNNRRLKNE